VGGCPATLKPKLGGRAGPTVIESEPFILPRSDGLTFDHVHLWQCDRKVVARRLAR
jgi:hypothetical protein